MSTSNYKSLEPRGFNRFAIGPTGLAVVAVLFIFGLLPFTQFLAGLKKPDMEVRRFDISVPPPAFVPPEPPPPEPPPAQEPPPKMDSPPPQLSLSQLNMAINPGLGGALAGGFALGDVNMSASETMNQISLFEISDLDEPPRKVRDGRIIWPPRMRREKVAGYIHLEGTIQEDGTVSYLRTVEASHSEYDTMFTRYINSLVYSVPTVGGKPVQARLVLKVPIKWE
jgi:protein TonB